MISPVELDPANWHKGQGSRDAGRAAAEWVIEAVRLAVADRIDGIVTAPLNKEAMNSAGYAYPGHTELLAEQAGDTSKAASISFGKEIQSSVFPRECSRRASAFSSSAMAPC